jgi:hypothetical protein
MSDNNGSSTGWGGWIAAIVVGAVLLWHFNRKPEPTPVTFSRDPVTTGAQNPPQTEKPRVDYDKLSAQELLVEARAAGLDPKVNEEFKLELKPRPDVVDLARAMYRREDDIISLLDPDALLRRQLVGTWTEVSRPRGGKERITFNADGTSKVGSPDDFVGTLLIGTINCKWSIKDALISLEYKGASGPIAPFAEWGMAGSVERFKILSLDANRLRVDWQGLPGLSGIREFVRK